MSGGDWSVESIEAYNVWVTRYRPSADHKANMARWLDDCQKHGPPPADDSDTQGNLQVLGTDGFMIYFRRFNGFMYVMRIA